MAWARNGLSEYEKLEQRLALLAWLNDQFGYQKNPALPAGMKGNGYFNALFGY